tara:strand:- start:21 stop:329 length:309 start_codon:yes stop_codon:yes gene_type:complete
VEWEVKELSDGRWGIYLCEKYWKFKDKPVMYAASISKELANMRVDRMNNPDGFSNDENCYTVAMARADAKKKRLAEREAEKQRKAEARAEKKRLREEAKKKK